VTGFDDIPMSEYTHPPLTTLHQPIYQIGVKLSEMLIKTIRGEALDRRKEILKPALVIRQSSGFAKV
jgi:LacI family transcriptional regulator